MHDLLESEMSKQVNTSAFRRRVSGTNTNQSDGSHARSRSQACTRWHCPSTARSRETGQETASQAKGSGEEDSKIRKREEDKRKEKEGGAGDFTSQLFELRHPNSFRGP